MADTIEELEAEFVTNTAKISVLSERNQELDALLQDHYEDSVTLQADDAVEENENVMVRTVGHRLKVFVNRERLDAEIAALKKQMVK